jgi:hypothetical protein
MMDDPSYIAKALALDAYFAPALCTQLHDKNEQTMPEPRASEALSASFERGFAHAGFRYFALH